MRENANEKVRVVNVAFKYLRYLRRDPYFTIYQQVLRDVLFRGTMANGKLLN